MKKSFSELIAVNKEGRFLLQHRTADAPVNPNKWGLFGGGMEEGESPEDALRRELMEELELPLKDIKLYKQVTSAMDGIIKTNYYFSA